MDTAQHCQDQASECHRLVKSTQNEVEAKILKELANSWMRVAGQMDRYQALKREQLRNASVCG
ncbi:hypothetical protein A5906_33960 [Bradyrhizobium sacchari]|uniref:Uncharacterized protein n=1 Tax=Bradyrhizobium sacchari TaxID=1399419 RepID=A0A560JN23_9BRAD|nr:hypothetical protein [Bradyrhizobium sacchari]OPY97966.1 hypothetical protein A5906_33960 [Bradyrhizobium sacchari]TWB59082.1 hypothetical protein FBZ94_105358 [Bradyrhizobium sacchari]TWB72558.1 hypothetical protein FBZ95_106273 [Bradyrhizobium sacchari]